MGVGMVGPSPVTQGYQTVSYTLRDNRDDSDSRRDHSPSLLEVTDTAGTIFYRSVAATLLDSKVSVTFSNQTPQTNGHLECLVFAISGDDVSAGVGFTIISTSTSANTTSTYGGLSFQPDLLMFASTNTTSGQGLREDAIFGFGASTRSPFKERCVSFFYDYNKLCNKILKKYGKCEINKIYLVRTGFAKLYTFITNVVTLFKYDNVVKQTGNNYHYHTMLLVEIKLENDRIKWISLEKNNCITFCSSSFNCL
jgi:hypothetical protein